jgi:hypothetical protein
MRLFNSLIRFTQCTYCVLFSFFVLEMAVEQRGERIFMGYAMDWVNCLMNLKEYSNNLILC